MQGLSSGCRLALDLRRIGYSLNFSLMHLAIFFWCSPNQAAEHACEVALGFESHVGCDFGERHAAFTQQVLGTLHALPHYILMGSCARTHLEELGEIVLAHSHNTG